MFLLALLALSRWHGLLSWFDLSAICARHLLHRSHVRILSELHEIDRLNLHYLSYKNSFFGQALMFLFCSRFMPDNVGHAKCKVYTAAPRHAHRRSCVCVCDRACACLSVCMSVPTWLCPFCYPSSSRHGYLIYFGGNSVYMYVCVCVCVCVIVSVLLLLIIGFSVISAACSCVWVWARVCVCVHAGAFVCSPFHSYIISDWKKAFLLTFVKRVTDGRTDGREGTCKQDLTFFLLADGLPLGSDDLLFRSRLAVQMLWLLFLICFRYSSAALN